MLRRKLSLVSLVLLFTSLFSIPSAQAVDVLKSLKFDGSIESRSVAINNEIDRNSSADDYRNETNTRLMFGMSFDLLDDVHSRVLLDRSPRFGTGSPSINDVESGFVFDNAYVKIDKVFGVLDLTGGKQFYGDPQDLNIYYGPQNDSILSVTSADLFRVDASIANGFVKFQGIAGKAAAVTTTTPLAGVVEDPTATRGTNHDTTVYGGELNTDRVIPMGNLAAYYYNAQTHAVKTAAVTGNDTLSVAGARAQGDIIAGFGYQAEYIQDFGRNNTVAGTPAYHGNAYFLNAHYGHEFDGRPVRAHIEYGRGSDDFVSIAPGRRFGIIWGEYSNFVGDTSTLNRTQATGLNNLKVFDGGIGINATPKLGFDFNAYRFQYDANLGGIGTSAGTEYDLIITWKHSENVLFSVNAADFQVGSSLHNGGVTPTNPITQLGADVKIKF